MIPHVPESEFLPFAKLFGRPSGDTRDSNLVKQLLPQTPSEARPNTLSSRYGTGAFPFHTETAYWKTPARYVALYCSDPGAGKRPTVLVDSRSWELDRRSRLLLCNEVWKVVSGRTRFLCNVLRNGDKMFAVRFDRECMRPAVSTKANAISLLDTLIAHATPIEIKWNKGDLLLFDNHRFLHSRGTSTVNDPDRRLLRILLATNEVW